MNELADALRASFQAAVVRGLRQRRETRAAGNDGMTDSACASVLATASTAAAPAKH